MDQQQTELNAIAHEAPLPLLASCMDARERGGRGGIGWSRVGAAVCDE